MSYIKIVTRIIFNYLYLYLISLVGAFIIFWCWLTYVDRLHMRERCRQIGLIVKKYIDTNMENQYKELLYKYLFYQLNAFSECIAGFTNGLIHNEPTIIICKVESCEMQTDNIVTEISIQTDPIEPVIREVIKEVIREVIKEVEVVREAISDVKEITKELAMPTLNDIDENRDTCVNMGMDIFGTKIKSHQHPTLEDDTKIDYDTMTLKKEKRVKIKEKRIVK